MNTELTKEVARVHTTDGGEVGVLWSPTSAPPDEGTKLYTEDQVRASLPKPYGWWLETGDRKTNGMYFYEAEVKAAWKSAGGAGSEAYIVPLYRSDAFQPSAKGGIDA